MRCFLFQLSVRVADCGALSRQIRNFVRNCTSCPFSYPYECCFHSSTLYRIVLAPFSIALSSRWWPQRILLTSGPTLHGTRGRNAPAFMFAKARSLLLCGQPCLPAELYDFEPGFQSILQFRWAWWGEVYICGSEHAKP